MNEPQQLTLWDDRALCQTCIAIAADNGWGPAHDASPRCESGRHPHCSCDTCF